MAHSGQGNCPLRGNSLRPPVQRPLFHDHLPRGSWFTRPSRTLHGLSKMSSRMLCRLLIVTGNSLTALGCLGLALSLAGAIDANAFSLGSTAGIRVIGSVAVAGCLFSAFGYFGEEQGFKA